MKGMTNDLLNETIASALVLAGDDDYYNNDADDDNYTYLSSSNSTILSPIRDYRKPPMLAQLASNSGKQDSINSSSGSTTTFSSIGSELTSPSLTSTTGLNVNLNISEANFLPPTPVAKAVVCTGWPGSDHEVTVDLHEKGTQIWGDPDLSSKQPVIRWLSSNRCNCMHVDIKPTNNQTTLLLNSPLNEQQPDENQRPLIVVNLEDDNKEDKIYMNSNETRCLPNDSSSSLSSSNLYSSQEVSKSPCNLSHSFEESSPKSLTRQNKHNRNAFNQVGGFDPLEAIVDTSTWGLNTNCATNRRWDANSSINATATSGCSIQSNHLVRASSSIDNVRLPARLPNQQACFSRGLHNQQNHQLYISTAAATANQNNSVCHHRELQSQFFNNTVYNNNASLCFFPTDIDKVEKCVNNTSHLGNVNFMYNNNQLMCHNSAALTSDQITDDHSIPQFSPSQLLGSSTAISSSSPLVSNINNKISRTSTPKCRDNAPYFRSISTPYSNDSNANVSSLPMVYSDDTKRKEYQLHLMHINKLDDLMSSPSSATNYHKSSTNNNNIASGATGVGIPSSCISSTLSLSSSVSTNICGDKHLLKENDNQSFAFEGNPSIHQNNDDQQQLLRGVSKQLQQLLLVAHQRDNYVLPPSPATTNSVANNETPVIPRCSLDSNASTPSRDLYLIRSSPSMPTLLPSSSLDPHTDSNNSSSDNRLSNRAAVSDSQSQSLRPLFVSTNNSSNNTSKPLYGEFSYSSHTFDNMFLAAPKTGTIPDGLKYHIPNPLTSSHFPSIPSDDIDQSKYFCPGESLNSLSISNTPTSDLARISGGCCFTTRPETQSQFFNFVIKNSQHINEDDNNNDSCGNSVIPNPNNRNIDNYSSINNNHNQDNDMSEGNYTGSYNDIINQHEVAVLQRNNNTSYLLQNCHVAKTIKSNNNVNNTMTPAASQHYLPECPSSTNIATNSTFPTTAEGFGNTYSSTHELASGLLASFSGLTGFGGGGGTLVTTATSTNWPAAMNNNQRLPNSNRHLYQAEISIAQDEQQNILLSNEITQSQMLFSKLTDKQQHHLLKKQQSFFPVASEHISSSYSSSQHYIPYTPAMISEVSIKNFQKQRQLQNDNFTDYQPLHNTGFNNSSYHWNMPNDIGGGDNGIGGDGIGGSIASIDQNVLLSQLFTGNDLTKYYSDAVMRQFRLSVHAGLLPVKLMQFKLPIEVLQHINQMFTYQLHLQQMYSFRAAAASSTTGNCSLVQQQYQQQQLQRQKSEQDGANNDTTIASCNNNNENSHLANNSGSDLFNNGGYHTFLSRLSPEQFTLHIHKLREKIILISQSIHDMFNRMQMFTSSTNAAHFSSKSPTTTVIAADTYRHYQAYLSNNLLTPIVHNNLPDYGGNNRNEIQSKLNSCYSSSTGSATTADLLMSSTLSMTEQPNSNIDSAGADIPNFSYRRKLTACDGLFFGDNAFSQQARPQYRPRTNNNNSIKNDIDTTVFTYAAAARQSLRNDIIDGNNSVENVAQNTSCLHLQSPTVSLSRLNEDDNSTLNVSNQSNSCWNNNSKISDNGDISSADILQQQYTCFKSTVEDDHHQQNTAVRNSSADCKTISSSQYNIDKSINATVNSISSRLKDNSTQQMLTTSLMASYQNIPQQQYDMHSLPYVTANSSFHDQQHRFVTNNYDIRLLTVSSTSSQQLPSSPSIRQHIDYTTSELQQLPSASSIYSTKPKSPQSSSEIDIAKTARLNNISNNWNNDFDVNETSLDTIIKNIDRGNGLNNHNQTVNCPTEMRGKSWKWNTFKSNTESELSDSLDCHIHYDRLVKLLSDDELVKNQNHQTNVWEDTSDYHSNMIYRHHRNNQPQYLTHHSGGSSLQTNSNEINSESSTFNPNKKDTDCCFPIPVWSTISSNNSNKSDLINDDNNVMSNLGENILANVGTVRERFNTSQNFKTDINDNSKHN
ncbi:hypothetical protein GJ496_008649 [Pomphorhynchus laevis]|nr:hypothetical protein GJ496_008649 [Pomphorhynchus laevis]